MPEQDNDQLQQDDQQQGQQQQQQQIDWETDDNPYKKRYMDSERQAPVLVNTLKQFAEYDHSTKTWKPKIQQSQQQSQTEDDVEKLLEGYDPDFRKSLKVYTQKQIDSALSQFRQESTFMAEYNKGVTSSRSKAISEFGNEYELATKEGSFNPNSPLYKLANDILTSDYAEFNSDGSFKKYTRPDAEYKAVAEAYAIMQRRAKQDNGSGKQKLGAIQGKGTGSGSGKKGLSFDEYEKLSDEEKDAYDMQQVG